ncbi:MAG: helix-turn-helix domain-containing protein, partial [Ilumatobacteraceae bacterium]
MRVGVRRLTTTGVSACDSRTTLKGECHGSCLRRDGPARVRIRRRQTVCRPDRSPDRGNGNEQVHSGLDEDRAFEQACNGHSHALGSIPKLEGFVTAAIEPRPDRLPDARRRSGVTPRAHEDLFDVAGLALYLGVGERFVRRLVDQRRIPFVKIGKFVRFQPADV